MSDDNNKSAPAAGTAYHPAKNAGNGALLAEGERVDTAR